MDIDWADPCFGLCVPNVEARFTEADVLVIERAELADARTGQSERGDDRATGAAGRRILILRAPVQIDSR